MRAVAAALLERVRTAGAVLEIHEDTITWRAPSPLSADLLDALAARKGDLLDALRGSQPLDIYRERIACAQCWLELYVVLADAEVAYVHGKVSGDDIDRLSDLCRKRSQQLPKQTETRGAPNG